MGGFEGKKEESQVRGNQGKSQDNKNKNHHFVYKQASNNLLHIPFNLSPFIPTHRDLGFKDAQNQKFFGGKKKCYKHDLYQENVIDEQIWLLVYDIRIVHEYGLGIASSPCSEQARRRAKVNHKSSYFSGDMS